jgi:hypothetical protein
VAGQGFEVWGEMGVGGGSRGPSAVTEGERAVSGLLEEEASSSEEETVSASSSQESAMTGAFFLGMGRGMSLMAALVLSERSLREEWSSEAVVEAAGTDIGAVSGGIVGGMEGERKVEGSLEERGGISAGQWEQTLGLWRGIGRCHARGKDVEQRIVWVGGTELIAVGNERNDNRS